MTIPHGSRALLMIPDAPVDVSQEHLQAKGSCCCGSHLGPAAAARRCLLFLFLPDLLQVHLRGGWKPGAMRKRILITMVAIFSSARDGGAAGMISSWK